jgi:hypothetical protein
MNGQILIWKILNKQRSFINFYRATMLKMMEEILDLIIQKNF